MNTGWLITKKFHLFSRQKFTIFPDFAYLIDDGIFLQDDIAAMLEPGQSVQLYVCNYSCQIRQVACNSHFIPSGLFMLSQLLSKTDYLIQDAEIYSYQNNS